MAATAIVPTRHLDTNRLGVLVFISSEAVFFLTLIITYIAYRYSSTSGPTPRQVLDVGTTAVFTVFLLSSSISMALVSSRLSRNDPAGVRRWLLVTIMLGLIFLVGQGYEYVRLYADNVTLARNLWSSTFFTLTGFHGFHVFVGLVSMSIVASVVRPGPEHPRGASAVEAISYYWHFVDAVWVVIFPVVYLWTLFS
jgi:heme/copper-type cytochrome/quinol oxidase subunit 3